MIRWLGGRSLIYLSTTVHGVAPVVNLGRHGWLIASLGSDSFSQACKSLYEGGGHPGRHGFVSLLSQAFNLPAAEDLEPLPSFASLQPREWADSRHPHFYWLPASGDLDGASCARISPRHLEYLTEQGVAITRLFFEPTTEAIQRRISSAKALWVERIRRGEAREPYWVSKPYGSFPAGAEVAYPRPMRLDLLER